MIIIVIDIISHFKIDTRGIKEEKYIYIITIIYYADCRETVSIN